MSDELEFLLTADDDGQQLRRGPQALGCTAGWTSLNARGGVGRLCRVWEDRTVSDRERRSIGLRRIAGLSVLGLGILAGGPVRALECPLPHPTGTPTAIDQTAGDIRTYAELLAAQGTGAVPEIVT